MGPPVPPEDPEPIPGSPSGSQVFAAAFSKITSGPLPPPELLAGYEQVCPGGADRIIRMAEAEGEHRRRMEEKMFDAQVEFMRRGYFEGRLGQIFAFSIAVIFLVGGSYVAIRGEPWAGGLFGSVGIASIVSAFIWGRTNKKGPE